MKNKYNPYECYWRREYQDMQVTVPTCEYYGKYGYCPCNYDCKHYISEQEIDNILRKISNKQFESEIEYERAIENLEHDIHYEPTYNQDDGSM